MAENKLEKKREVTGVAGGYRAQLAPPRMMAERVDGRVAPVTAHMDVSHRTRHFSGFTMRPVQ